MIYDGWWLNESKKWKFLKVEKTLMWNICKQNCKKFTQFTLWIHIIILLALVISDPLVDDLTNDVSSKIISVIVFKRKKLVKSQRSQGVDTGWVCVVCMGVITAAVDWRRGLFNALYGLQCKTEVMRLTAVAEWISWLLRKTINNHNTSWWASCHTNVIFIIILSNFGTTIIVIFTIMPLVVKSPSGVHKKIAHSRRL